MKESIIITKSSAQTRKLGKVLAETLLKSRLRDKAIVVGLRGDLGGGKTTFLQGFTKGLGIKEKVLSPTFIIMRRRGNFYHIDAYRLQGTRDLLKLGFKKNLADPKNVVVVEWADKIKKIMPSHTVWIDFDFVDKNKRKITIKIKDGR
ncbi:MAG: tRNA (adenosine(37)-N6)-threonylcarbamoyltransferase complex ATPase subunit type 1 TsaE [Candidatus Nealsonbacteria bacterium]